MSRVGYRKCACDGSVVDGVDANMCIMYIRCTMMALLYSVKCCVMLCDALCDGAVMALLYAVKCCVMLCDALCDGAVMALLYAVKCCVMHYVMELYSEITSRAGVPAAIRFLH